MADPDGDGATISLSFCAAATRTASTRATSPKAQATPSSRPRSASPIRARPATVVTRFLGENGRSWSGAFPIPAGQSRSFAAEGRFASSFSTVIESSQPLVADRVMTWGGGYGSHSETATAACRRPGSSPRARPRRLELFYLLQNPAATPANVSVTYLLPAPAAPITLPYTIAAESRLTIPVDDIPGLEATDVSARIVSDVPILVERAMYMDTSNPVQVFGAGHAGSGVTAANPRWFLAEGATGGFFDMSYLIANPSTLARTWGHVPAAERRAAREGIRGRRAEPAHDLGRRRGSAADRYAGVCDPRIAQRRRHRRRAIDVVARGAAGRRATSGPDRRRRRGAGRWPEA